MAEVGGLKKPPAMSAPSRPPPRAPGPRKPAGFYQPEKERRGCCRRFCLCCCCFTFVLFLLIIAFIAIFYAYVQPKVPVFRFKPIELDRFNISAKPDGTASINSQIIIRVEARNPNGKMIIYYGETKVSLTADNEIDLGTESVPEFKQPVNNMTLLKFTVTVNNKMVDSTIGLRLKDRVKNQQVVVNAVVKTKVGVGVFNVKIGMLDVNVNCGGVTLKQLNDGNASPKCTLNTLRWINIK